MAKIEVEIRGRLSSERFAELKKFLDTEGVFVKRLDRFSMIYWPPKPQDPGKLDVRIRINNGVPEVVMKLGQLSRHREELSFAFDKAKFIEVIKFLQVLGFTKCLLQSMNRLMYTYKNSEIALGYIPGFGYPFEIEKLVDNTDVKKANAELRSLCKEMGIRPYTEKDYDNQIDIMSKKQRKFDLEKQPLNGLRKYYSKYLS